MTVNKRHVAILTAAVTAVVGLSGCGSTPRVEPIVQAATPTPKSVVQLKQIDSLQNEVRELRNQIEEQQFELENISQRQQDLFQGLDQRLRVVESAPQAMQPIGALDSNPVRADTDTSLPPLQLIGSQDLPVNEIPVLDAPVKEAVVSVPSADQQALYDQGFESLKRSQYSEAIDKFTLLVAQFPNGGLADDASHWIGEANYVNRQYEASIRAFRKVVTQYPSSDRVPEALLKVGYVQYDIGDYGAAKETFTDVLRRYPDHPVAISAKSRIERIARGIGNK